MSFGSGLPGNLNLQATKAGSETSQPSSGLRGNDGSGDEFSKALEESAKRLRQPDEETVARPAAREAEEQRAENEGKPTLDGRSSLRAAIHEFTTGANEPWLANGGGEAMGPPATADGTVPPRHSLSAGLFLVRSNAIEADTASASILANSDGAASAGQGSKGPSGDATALGELLEEHDLLANRRSGPGPQASETTALEMTVRRQEKHLPTSPLWRPGSPGASEPAVSLSADTGLRVADRPSGVKDAQARSPSAVDFPMGEPTDDLQTAGADGGDVAAESGSGADGFAQQLTRRISRQIGPPSAPLAPSNVAMSQPRPSVGGNVVRILELGLEPASLGALTLRLSLKGQELSISLTAGTQSALDAINNERDSLEAALRSAGYTIDELKIHRADPEQLRSQPQDQQLRGDGAGRNSTSGRGDGNGDTSGSGPERHGSDDTGRHLGSSSANPPADPGSRGGRLDHRAVVV